jgi:ribosomal protein S18 acetylase RimI-like enzyme
MNGAPVIRDVDASRDANEVTRLWRDYLGWGNDGLESRYGFRLPVDEAVEQDLDSIAKFLPPDGRLLLAVHANRAIGTSALQRIGPETAEIKRMWVDPAHRRAGIARAMLDHLIAAAVAAGYERIRLDSPDFMTSAHALYRSFGFVTIGPYPESEIPDKFKSHWVFMERALSHPLVG